MVRKFIMTPGALIVFVVLCAVAVGLQSFIMNRIKANSVLVANAACSVEKVSPVGSYPNSPQMDVNCAGHKDWLQDSVFIVSYLQHPGPITCTLYENQSHAECSVVKNKRS